MALSTGHSISVAEIVIYTPFLSIGVWLSIRHGFGRNAGWLYLILFSLIRLIGSALELATINNPLAFGLYVGYGTMQGIGLSALLLILLGLLSRALANIRSSGKAFVEPLHLRLVQTLVLVALILGIVGGVKSGTGGVQSLNQSGIPSLKITNETKAGLALMIVAYAIICAATVVIGVQLRTMEESERKIIPAVAASLPFVLVRIIYSCIGTYGGNTDFRTFTGDLWIFLGMSVIMEMVVVLICEVTGLLLRRIPRGHPLHNNEHQMKVGPQHENHHNNV
jgi:hypothetical protein